MLDISKKTGIVLASLLLFLAAAGNLYSDSVWEGSAAMGRYGEFPLTGYYGASNSFPRNAYVEVENLDNGKKTRLIVVDRMSSSGLLLLISNEAAQALGVYQNDIVRVKVRMISSGAAEQSVDQDDLAYSPDPDLNPAAALAPQNSVPAVRTVAEPETPSAAEPETEAAETASAETEEPGPVIETAQAETLDVPPVNVKPRNPVPAVEPETETEPVQAEPEPEPAQTKPRNTTPPRVVVRPEEEEPPELLYDKDDLSEAEILEREADVPRNIASDIPEKPFDWPEGEVRETGEDESELLYLTMENVGEGTPVEPAEGAPDTVDEPEALVLWPDDSIPREHGTEEESVELAGDTGGLRSAEPADSAEGVSGIMDEAVQPELRLVDSGIRETAPVYKSDDSFSIAELPEIIQRESDREYVTESSDYKNPSVREAAVTAEVLPVPEPDIPEEVIAVLAGDSIYLSEAWPETEGRAGSFADTPEVVITDEHDNGIIADLKEAVPRAPDYSSIAYNDSPEIPGSDDKFPIEVADGYITPGPDEFETKVSDIPGIEGLSETEVPEVGDELAFSEPPEAEDLFPAADISELPELEEKTEIEAPEGEMVSDELEPAVPEYDENLEITLEPAEVRPPELVDGENELAESSPEQPDVDVTVAETPKPERGTGPEETLASADAPAGKGDSTGPLPEPEKEPLETVETLASADTPAPVPEKEPGPLAEPEPETAETAEAAEPVETAEPAETVTVVVKAAEPEKAPEREPAPAAESPAAPPLDAIRERNVVMASKLEQQRHYLQIGAYREKNSALRAAGRLEDNYPVTILEDEATGGTSYKLLVGPLTADESGILLYNFRSGGYSDAFIRRIE